MNSLHLHRKLVQHLAGLHLPLSQPQQRHLAEWCQALAVSPNCHLATLALGLPLPGQRENLIQRLRRDLKTEQLQSDHCYQAVVRHLFAHWQGREVSLVMDRTDLEHRWSVLTLGAAYHRRLVPLAWQVLPFGGTSAAEQIKLLNRVQPHLPSLEQVRVHFYGDSEFRAVPLQQVCRKHHWHWQVGLKSDMYLGDPTGQWRQLADLGLQAGQRRYLNQVYLTHQHQFGPVNLLADWSPNQDSPRYWALDLPADAQAWRRGRKRFWIEPTYRDWKSYGFDLEHSQIDDPDRLEVLLLGIACTTVWMLYLGDWLTQHGHAKLLASAHRNDYSLFRLGRDYLQRALTMGWHIPVGFTLSHG
jgi:hypothetical protein